MMVRMVIIIFWAGLLLACALCVSRFHDQPRMNLAPLFRSKLAVPCGVLLRHFSSRTHSTMAPNSSMSCFAMLSLWIRAPANGHGGIGFGSTRTSGLSPLSTHTVDGLFVPSVRRFQSSDFASSEYTALLFLIPSQSPILFLGFILSMGSVEICF